MERIVKLTCFNCSHKWKKELESQYRIGKYRRLDGGLRKCSNDTVCIQKKDYAPHKVTCPICGMDGPHDIQSIANDS